MSRIALHNGDCREVLKTLKDCSVDAIVTDPPYHLTTGKKGGSGEASVNLDSPYGRARVTTGFMGMTWDGGQVAHDPAIWAECLRVAKPGAHLVAFGGTRTFHRLACAIEDAGWELRDTGLRGHTPEDCPWLMGWIYGSGFPKSHNGEWGGTAFKPAWEPIVCARKPLIGTVAENFAQYGTGGLNVDACRIDGIKDVPASPRRAAQGAAYGDLSNDSGTGSGFDPNVGRWPANLIHDGSPEVVALFPQSAGQSGAVTGEEPSAKTNAVYGQFGGRPATQPRGDEGSAARFFYCAKATREDREEGLEMMAQRPREGHYGTVQDKRPHTPDGYEYSRAPRANHHPTVKPTELMRWLVRLITPAGGLVLDPFMGSGSTGKAAMLEGMRFTGIDLTPEYVEIARARIEFAARQGHQQSLLEAA